jgi:hypothetical protein
MESAALVAWLLPGEMTKESSAIVRSVPDA